MLLDLGGAASANAEAWVEAAASIKQLTPGSSLLGEEWLTGPYAVASYTVALAETLEALDHGRDPLADFQMHSVPGDRIAIEVLPHGLFESLLFHGFCAEVWMPPSTDAAAVRAHAGLAQRRPTESGGLALVLGAGNITSIAPLDVLYQLYAYNRVVLLKLNPVTDPMRPILERVFARMIERGVVQIVSGGAESGAFLAGHPSISAIHITGSEATHDAIVFGHGDAGAAAKAANAPLLQTPISSELGGVSPTIVLPGDWSARDLRYQAEHVVTQKLHNNGCNCIASQVVIVSSDWAQRDAFLDQLRIALAGAPQRAAYYPGSDSRIRTARAAYPARNCSAIGATAPSSLVSPLRTPLSPRSLRSTSRQSLVSPNYQAPAIVFWGPRSKRPTSVSTEPWAQTSSRTRRPCVSSARAWTNGSRDCGTAPSRSTPGPALAL